MKRLFIFFLICALTSLAFSAEPHHQLTRVYIHDEAELLLLMEFDPDIATVERGVYVELVTVKEELEALREAGFKLEVRIADMEKHYVSQNPNMDPMGGFLTFDEMVDRLFEIHSDYPDITTAPYSIGQSWEGRELWMIKVSDNPDIDEDEPEVWYDGLHHAREPITHQLLIYYLEYLCENYGVNPAVTEVVDERELFILPCVNPDGYVYNQTTNPNGGGMWRKNRRDNGGGSYGVDLNRNYPYDWGHDNQGSSPNPSSGTYRGPSPGSEPEIQAILEYINSRHIALSHSYHSYGNLVLIPWCADYNGYTPDHNSFMAIGNQISTWNGYEVGTVWELLYNVNGGSIDWHYGQQDEHFRIMAFSQEVGPSFWPPESSIQGLCEENLMPNLYVAQIADQYAPPAVALVFIDMEIDDSSGNNNGAADPGEDIGLTIIIRNNGTGIASGINGVLSTIDPYISITSANSAYPDIASLSNGENTTLFQLEISLSCPFGHEAELELDMTAGGGYSETIRFNLQVGDPMYLPSGPDNYGYLAYDPNDLPELPEYDWVEICPDSGGSGTIVPFVNDDQVLHFALPFDFQYYGQTFDSLTIATNGWLGMGIIDAEDYSNSGIPDDDGPAGMIASYWEDLSPQRPNSGGVWYWYDEVNHLFIVEYNHVEQFAPTDNFETFQTILYDPAHYPTSTGDGRIKVQYKDMSAVSPYEGTIGIESPDETDGIQYLFDGNLDIHAMPLGNEMAILYTTPTSTPDITIVLTPENPPIVISAGGGSFNFNLNITNIGSTPVVFDGWIEAVLPDSSIYGPIILREGLMLAPGASIQRDLTQNIPGRAPGGDYAYTGKVGSHPDMVFSESSFPFSKSGVDNSAGGNWELWGWRDEPSSVLSAVPTEFALSQNYPNPFNPETTIEFALPEASRVKLAIFNIRGQQVVVLAEGNFEAGYHTLSWNANGITSGIYFYLLKAGDFSEVRKCVLIK